MEKNIAQERAIQTIEGQVLLISCPGSGKTTTMIRRIKAMIDAGIDASKIIMVTFTDAAALEMRERFFTQYGKCNATFSTIHALCLRILSGASDMPLRVMKPHEQMNLLYSCLRSARIPAGTALKDIVSDISAYKNSEVSMKEFSPSILKPEEFARVYELYEAKKKQSDFLDFDDMLCLCRDLLLNNPKILRQCREKYQYIMCDEYQDTNRIQKEILYLLAGENGNLCVVGDDDQSIYGFRGALPVIMMDFKKDYPNVCEISMDINYRSRPEIITAAKNLIEHNTERFSKDIMAARDGHGEVIYKTLTDRKEELDFLSTTISRITASGADPSKIAILARTNMQMDDVAAEFERRRINYTSNDAIKDVYEHFIFEDIVAYLRIINWVWEANDLLQILNKPVRYLREIDFRGTMDLSLDTLIRNVRKNPNCRDTNVDAVVKLFDDIHALQNLSLAEQVRGIAERIGYRTYLNDYAKNTELNDEFLTAKLDYFINDAEQYASIDEWLKKAASHIQQHKKQMRERSGKAVTLSTMHRAKGLEWDTVFIIDCCHGSIPISKAKTKSEIEEERRLFYVAATRARESLYLLNYSQKIASKDKITRVKASMFIKEMKDGTPVRTLKDQELDEKRQTQMKEIESEFAEGDIRHFQVGMSVHHQTFGPGIVISKTLFFVNVHFAVGNKMFSLK